MPATASGWFEGDTLVVETISMNPTGGGSAPLTPAGKIIERFTAITTSRCSTRFEVNDPALYSQVWKGEIGLNAAPQPLRIRLP